MRRVFVILGLSLAATNAHAGLVYDFVTTVAGQRSTQRFAGRVTVDANRYRVDLASGDVVISTDGDATALIYDIETNTWSQRHRFGVTRSSILFQLPIPRSRVEGRPRVRLLPRGVETIEGRSATRHEMEISYRLVADVDEDKVRGNVRATVRIWTDESLPPLPMQRDLQTGFPVVDARIRKVSAAIKGMVLRHELEVERSLEGGAAIHEKTVTVVSNLVEQDIDATLFDRR